MIIIDENIEFEWDFANGLKNWIKHKVTMKETEQVFINSKIITRNDKKHSIYEQRFNCLGETNVGRLLSIFFALRDNKVRVISARPMNRKEKFVYEKA